MEKAIIRMIGINDYEDIYHLNKQLGYDYEKERIYKRILSILEAGNDVLLVAQVDHRIVGYAHGAPYETLYCDNLLNTICFCVDEDLQNRSEIAIALYEAYERKAKNFGYKGIRLVIDQERQVAQQLFLSQGFESKRIQNHFIKYFTD